MSRLAAVVLLAAALLAHPGCGEPPDPLYMTSAPLHDGNGMWIGGPTHMTGTYSCAGQTWTMKGDFDQAWSAPLGRYLSRVAQWTAVDSSRPEAMLSGCINATEGNQFYMSFSGAYVLYNVSPKTCLMYSHTTGASGWTAVANVTINPADFQYVQPGGPRGIQDRFAVVVTPTSGVGNPGVCSSMNPTFYFASP